MIIRFGLLILLFNFVTTSEDSYKDGGLKNSVSELDNIYSLWPSVHNAARLMRLRKREAQSQVGQNEGGGTDIKIQNPVSEPTQLPVNTANKQTTNSSSNNSTNNTLSQDHLKANETLNDLPKNVTQSNTTLTAAVNSNEAKANNETTSSQLDINNPGVLKRGLIVFGGFALMAGAYFIFYRRSGKKNDANNSHNTSETNQFRYGVLQSDDRRENMELSRIPLTMDSDEDDDEDLEIFDLGQKKKSLSYVNLQTHEDEAVNNSIDIDKDGDNLLLDIEDASSDTLINWSNNGNKSIL